MARRRNPLWQATVAGLSVFFYYFFQILPLPVGRRLALLLGRLALLLPRLHKVGRQNLDLAYGDTLSAREKRHILRGAAQNMLLVAAEFPHLPALARQDVSQLSDISGIEHLPRDQGAILVGAHCGNWEWLATLVAHRGFPAAEVVRPLDNPTMNRLVDSARRASGLHTIAKDDAGPEIFRLLRENYKIGILIDQSPRHNAVPVTFFGAPCWATIAPVMIAVRARVPVFPVVIHRKADWRYAIDIQPELELKRTGDLQRDLVENTQRCQDAIEALIRAHPEQWLWFHRRWKTRPRLEAEWEVRRERLRKRGAKPEEIPTEGTP
jgi:Kdo2-lipid IVA lauroyltransferase/acyltransferase